MADSAYILIDSSVYLSALLPSDQNHESSKTFFKALKTKEALTILAPLIVVLEILNNLNRNSAVASNQFILSAFLEQERCITVDMDADFLLNIYLPHYQKLSLKTSNSIIAATAMHYKAHLITWDKKMIEQTKKHLSSLTPARFLRRL